MARTREARSHLEHISYDDVCWHIMERVVNMWAIPPVTQLHHEVVDDHQGHDNICNIVNTGITLHYQYAVGIQDLGKEGCNSEIL